VPFQAPKGAPANVCGPKKRSLVAGARSGKKEGRKQFSLSQGRGKESTPSTNLITDQEKRGKVGGTFL